MKSLKPAINLGAIFLRSDGEPIRTTHVVKVNICVLSLDACRPWADLAASDKSPSSMSLKILCVFSVALIDLPKKTKIFTCRGGRTGGAPSAFPEPKYRS